jgi:rhamnogalacturonan endolyase
MIARAIILLSLLAVSLRAEVVLTDKGKTVELSNGTIIATIDKAGSTITSMKLGPHELISPNKPVYFSMGGGKSYRQPRDASFRIVQQTPEIAEVAFLQKWTPGNNQAVDIEVRYALKQGESGIHTYGILSHPADYPETVVGEWRMVWGMPALNDKEWLMEKIRVDPLRNWEMPSPADLAKAKPTDIKEIVEITSGPRAGKFDCKYDFNLEYYSTGCWGHASDRNKVGAWIVLGSHEFFNDGPLKQDLSSASSLIHIHFGMNHFGGSSTRLAAGEDWKKIYGPYLLYGNQGKDADALWADARAKAASERKLWPHAWVKDHDIYPPSSKRGTLTGKITFKDSLKPTVSSAGAWVGLSQPKPGGNWQNESNHYQYWAKADASGSFSIPHIRSGTYILSAFNNGAIGEFTQNNVTIKSGSNRIDDMTWNIPRHGKSIAWEIGTPDRRAAEFRHGNDYFQGYLWKNFSKEFPNPLIYQIGKSDPARDWNYAQGAYLVNGQCVQWPWKIQFPLQAINTAGKARLNIAWASADRARVMVQVNGKSIFHSNPPVGGGNALLREGIHAKYAFSSLDFPASLLKPGDNVITLTQTSNHGPGSHVMYDALSLELP